MNILLDTHIWIWTCLKKDRIGRRLAAALEDPDNQIWLSAISIWEAMFVFQSGRVRLTTDPGLWIRQTLATGQFLECTLTNEIAICSHMIDLSHKDPADRFIAATALVNGFTLATADENLLACRTIRTLPNR